MLLPGNLLNNFASDFLCKSSYGILLTKYSFHVAMQLSGLVDDCLCDIQTLEGFNNDQVYPLISKLVKRDFFRYYKVWHSF